MDFEWDAGKANDNARNHGVSFQEASTCFRDPWQVMMDDLDSSPDEMREVLFGRSAPGRLLAVCYTLRGDTIRIISARTATRQEREDYARRI